MEQLTAIVYDNVERGICVGYKDVTRQRVLGPRPHAGHAADAGRRHVRSGRPDVQLTTRSGTICWAPR